MISVVVSRDWWTKLRNRAHAQNETISDFVSRAIREAWRKSPHLSIPPDTQTGRVQVGKSPVTLADKQQLMAMARSANLNQNDGFVAVINWFMDQ